MTPAERVTANRVSELFVVQKTEFFADVQLWPDRQVLDPRRWLDNFLADERELASHLLNVFLFFNERLCDALLRNAVQSLSVDLVQRASSFADARSGWAAFRNRIIGTYVHGEKPRATDSGYLFARKARQILELSQSRILHPAEVVENAVKESPHTILLFDDFVGSGRQMAATWLKRYPVSSGGELSIGDLALRGWRLIYLPLVATRHGLKNIARDCPGLEVRPAHELDNGYNLTNVDCVLWPTGLADQGRQFLEAVSQRAGITGRSPIPWDGYHGLGLSLAFSHGVPDATLPLFYWDRNGWRPLIRRT